MGPRSTAGLRRIRQWCLVVAVAVCPASRVLAQTTRPADKNGLRIELGRDVKMEFVRIEPGSFWMGSENGDASESPVHKVNISEPFYLGKYPVTQEQWQAVMGSNPTQPQHFAGPQNPVIFVSWTDCQQFLSKIKERFPAGMRPVVPTEAQWEYACRAGRATAYHYGDDPASLGEYAWFTANAAGVIHPVGRKKPNDWGLHDMHGNTWQWCADWHGKYPQAEQTDPLGPEKGTERVLRGGSWHSKAEDCRSTSRYWALPDFRYVYPGVRLAAEISAPAQ